MVATNTISVSARCSSTKAERAVVEARPCGRSTPSTSAVEPGGVAARRLAHEIGADHRRHRQRHHGRDHDGEGERHREFAEQPADDAAHEQQRNEGGDQRHARSTSTVKPICLAPIKRRAQRRIAALEIAEHVLDHHDGVVDDEADRNRERHQRQIVDREAGRPHRRAGAGERQRHGDAGGRPSPPAGAGTANTTSITSTIVAASVSCMSCTLARMVCVRSVSTEMSSPAGIHCRSSGSSS